MNIQDLRKISNVLIQGMHQDIVQSMLDYDYLIGKSVPSIKLIIAHGRKNERFFWGKDEIMLPVYDSLEDVEKNKLNSVDAVLNVQSSRNVKRSVYEASKLLSNLKLISIFAENTPEIHTLELIKESHGSDLILVGPSSVGVLIPGTLKIGAIGGTKYNQLASADIIESGDVAVVTTSGGMVNEIIHTVASRGRRVSFALAMGGDRYPLLDPQAAMLLAEEDPLTKEIIYFGELGGDDEYRIAELVKSGKITKPVIAYIAGVVAEVFKNPPQFGHAKALAQNEDETAASKKEALKAVGVRVCDRFGDIAKNLTKGDTKDRVYADENINLRRKAYFMSHVSGEKNGDVELLGKSLIETVESNSIASLVISLLMGKQVTSKKLIDFTDLVLRLLVDHSPNVSGAVNTIITARAGRDLVSSLSAGLLTIGPRFGGAVNAAANVWLQGANQEGVPPQSFVENIAKAEGAIPGIGHKKYRVDNPDPRVDALMEYSSGTTKYVDFARSIEAVTISKKSNLILNVDGAIAAILLDIFSQELNYTTKELEQLVEIEFFNALFVLSRSIGFTAHYLDQRRYDEGLFRLDDGDIRYFS